ncbi:MAG: hypothetical protein A2102_02015 [Tenericutes bacterium GWF2_38_8]|nr:MAG: hypothetical protein A2Y43_02240 [Tenericutes bacterium GWA2_38_26]OHE41884.1 MAG: hypothetical protein A2102_02015 [Tenericutes bacterium GWF2_38_8]HCB66109.1 methionine ABC transporter ATP-binding protein [Acholeplasmataceae bacterium]
MIKLIQVNKTYTSKNENFQAIKEISLDISDGEIVGIVGYSGAGKSTLIRMINGLILPTSGEIWIDGTLLSSLKQQDINRMRFSMGMIFQHFNLLSSMTVYDNVKLALSIAKYPKDQINSRISEVLSLVGLLDKSLRYPKELSGGERQRVGIARAIANNPKYLLCDEATSALDQNTASEIINLLRDIQMKTKITIIFITHQIEVAKDLCSRVIVMHQGMIVEDQSTRILFTKPQSAITKSLVKSLIYDAPLHSKNVYELIYDHRNTEDTSLSDMVKKYLVDVNIMHAKTLMIGDEHIGYLYVQITGNQHQEALNYLESKGIEVSLYV